jgi:RNA polymerase sigma-70 factor (ECF subfamily)
MASDWEALLMEARSGNSEVLGRLLQGYRSYLRLLAEVEIGRRLQGKVDASDVIQEVFLDAHRYFPQFRGEMEAQFIRWLREILAGTIANLVRRYLGTKARDVRLEQAIAADLDQSSQALGGVVIDPHSSPSQQVAQAEQAFLVAEAMGRLPEDYRKVLTMRHLEGLTFPEIAKRMDRSVDSVEKLWLRGLAKLKKTFGEVSE